MPSTDLERLRGLLRDAAEAAEALGDEPRPEPAGVGYFADAEGGLADAVEEIATHDGDISMFVGAGVSMEAGLPSWNALVRALLDHVADDLDAEHREQWIDTTLSHEGPLAAAAIAKALQPEEAEFRRSLRSALYGARRPGDYLPAALAQQIAWLKKQLGSRLHLLTANYDGLLESALEEQGLEPVSYVRARKEPEGKAAVWHLHGRLMLRASGSAWLSEGQLVLAEGDYARSSYVTWPQEHVGSRLRDSLCVFIGLSMTDQNFIRWLYRYGTETDYDHLTIFVRQSSPIGNDALRQKLETSTAARWALSGVRPVWANYYGEVAQLVHEAGLRIIQAGATPLEDRAKQRFEAAEALLAPDDEREFVEAQRDATSWLNDRIDEIRRIARQASVNLDDEDLGLGLWAANHQRGVAVLWATSERVLVDKNALEERPLHVASRWVGVEAMTRGVPVEQDPAVYTTRWRFIRGIPIVVDPMAERSVVGAVTLTSATELDACPLSVEQAPAGLLRELDRFLADSAAEFFV